VEQRVRNQAYHEPTSPYSILGVWYSRPTPHSIAVRATWKVHYVC